MARNYKQAIKREMDPRNPPTHCIVRKYIRHYPQSNIAFDGLGRVSRASRSVAEAAQAVQAALNNRQLKPATAVLRAFECVPVVADNYEHLLKTFQKHAATLPDSVRVAIANCGRTVCRLVSSFKGGDVLKTATATAKQLIRYAQGASAKMRIPNVECRHTKSTLRRIRVPFRHAMWSQNLLEINRKEQPSRFVESVPITLDLEGVGRRQTSFVPHTVRLKDRSLFGRFVRLHNLRPGDYLLFEERAPGRWRLMPEKAIA